MKRCEATIEIPIDIIYEVIKAHGDNWNDPHIRDHIEIDGIEFSDNEGKAIHTMAELKFYVMRTWPEKLLEECQLNEE